MRAVRRRTRPNAPVLKALGYLAGWALVAVPVAYIGFMAGSRHTVVAGHDATVSATRDGYATVDLGAYLPNVRYPTERPIGVRVEVGKTNLDSYEALLQRYAYIGSHPEGEVDKVSRLVSDMLIDNALQGTLMGLAGPFGWLLVGERRRAELARSLTPRRLAAGGGLVVLLATLSTPWAGSDDAPTVAAQAWQPVGTLIPGTTVGGDAAKLEIQSGLITDGTQRLIESAFDTYEKSLGFYRDLAQLAPAVRTQLRQPREDETVALLVTDRHDNVGMDPVSRALADAGGATVLLDAGDDTSTGEEWEAFSLDSLAASFEEFEEKYAVQGNHDNGPFVGDYLAERDFTVLEGEIVTTSDDIVLLGAPDPRSSGLGSWRTEGATTLDEQGVLLADTACASAEEGERVSTLLVHDASVGTEALRRGCVDLVLGGHLHVQKGPEQVVGDNGTVGTTYTNGTTGGAAYAVALGSKLRRAAQVTLVTYVDGRPVGLQPVTITTTGGFRVEEYIPLPTAEASR